MIIFIEERAEVDIILVEVEYAIVFSPFVEILYSIEDNLLVVIISFLKNVYL
jgi:hypothetical protein